MKGHALITSVTSRGPRAGGTASHAAHDELARANSLDEHDFHEALDRDMSVSLFAGENIIKKLVTRAAFFQVGFE